MSSPAGSKPFGEARRSEGRSAPRGFRGKAWRPLWLLAGVLAAILGIARLGAEALEAGLGYAESGWTDSIGISRQELIHLIVPDVDEKAMSAQARGSHLDLSVASYRATDLGLKGRRFLVAAIDSVLEGVPDLVAVEIGIVDIDKKTLLWKTIENNVELENELELIPGVAAAKRVGFVYRTRLETDFGLDSVRERWFQPRLDESGGFTCEEIWSGLVKVSNGANRGGRREWSCGTVLRTRDTFRWSFQVHRFLAEDRGCLREISQESWDAMKCDAKVSELVRCGKTTEIRRVENWEVREGHPVRVSVDARRLDHGGSAAFPFNLPQRSIRWRLSKVLPKPESHAGTAERIGGLAFRKRADEPFGDSVELIDEAGRVVRVVIPSNHDGFGCAVESLGWATNGKRFFAVVRLGPERALLSFSVAGGVDYWERTLSDSELDWPEGFVLEPAS